MNSNNKSIIWFLCFVAIVATIIPIVGSLIKGYIGGDSAYYICMAQLTSHGYVPYIDFSDGYTPLWTYLAAGLKRIFQIADGNYVFYLVFHYCFVVGVAFCIYKIARLFGNSKNQAFFGSWLFLLMSHWLEGNMVMLEMPSLFFGMISVWLTLKYSGRNAWNYVWIGMVTACSFLCKQFGLGFLALNLFLILAVNRQTWRECVCFAVGYFIPVLLCFLFWGNSFLAVIFNKYGTVSAKEVGLDVSFGKKMNNVCSGLWYFCYMVCPAVLIAVLNLPYIYKTKKLWIMLYCFCGIIGFSLQFWFANFSLHYLLYMVPFAVLLMVEMMGVEGKKWLKYLNYTIIGMVALVSIYKTYYNRVYKLYVSSNIKQSQVDFSREVKKYVPDDAQLWVAHGGLYYLYLTTGNMPPNLSSIGYSFGPLGLNENKAFDQAKEADYVIRFLADYPYEAYFTDSLKYYIEQYQSVQLKDEIGNDILLYDMSKPLNVEE